MGFVDKEKLQDWIEEFNEDSYEFYRARLMEIINETEKDDIRLEAIKYLRKIQKEFEEEFITISMSIDELAEQVTDRILENLKESADYSNKGY